MFDMCAFPPPINVAARSSGHWVLVIVDNRSELRILLYFDPLGNRPRLKRLWSKLQRAFGKRAKVLRERVQHDGDQCGVWCGWAAMLFVEKLAGLGEARDFSLSDAAIRINSSVQTDQEANTLAVLNKRELLRVAIETLLVE